jgi:multidrug efflux system membrane fusion protein
MDTFVQDTEARRGPGEMEPRPTARPPEPPHRRPGIAAFIIAVAVLAAIGAGVVLGPRLLHPHGPHAAPPPPPGVAVSVPLQRAIAERLSFLGQFSAVESVELRAQVGGILTQIGFKDGDIVKKGDLLFQIDPTPYLIQLSRAQAQAESARARLNLGNQEALRANNLKKTGAGSTENADQKSAEQRAAQATLDQALSAIRDAQFDLDRTRIAAPFTGRIGNHQVSVGNLVSGSRAGTSPTTLLTTLVSTDTIYLNFDMSEADYMTFLRNRQKQGGALAAKVRISLSDEKAFRYTGTLDFINNALDRSSGTIHARATVPDADGLMTPGGFARVRFDVSSPVPAMLVPDASVLPDQSDYMVLTLGPDNVVTPKHVQVGDLQDGLRVIRSGLSAADRVIIDGIPVARPGAKVSPHDGLIKVSTNEPQG